MDVFREVRYSRFIPYSDVSTKDLGKSSQGMTCPSFSAADKNSFVRWDTEVLSRSKMPMMDLSRTAISPPMFRYISLFPLDALPLAYRQLVAAVVFRILRVALHPVIVELVFHR